MNSTPTPETDAEVSKKFPSFEFPKSSSDWSIQYTSLMILARQLERQRDEAREHVANFEAQYCNQGESHAHTFEQLIKCEKERDQLRKQNEMDTIRFREMQEHGDRREVEHEQLRNVADELAEQLRHKTQLRNSALDSYSQLPHVLERNKAK